MIILPCMDDYITLYGWLYYLIWMILLPYMDDFITLYGIGASYLKHQLEHLSWSLGADIKDITCWPEDFLCSSGKIKSDI